MENSTKWIDIMELGLDLGENKEDLNFLKENSSFLIQWKKEKEKVQKDQYNCCCFQCQENKKIKYYQLLEYEKWQRQMESLLLQRYGFPLGQW